MNFTISALTTSLSRERITVYQNYVRSVEKNLMPSDISARALDLYVWNIQISSALLEIISLFEVTLRNKIFSVIERSFNDSIIDKYFLKGLPLLTREKVNKLKEIDSNITNPLIVSRLSFSFWKVVLETYFYYSGKTYKDGRPAYPRLYRYNRVLFSSAHRRIDDNDKMNKFIKKLIDATNEINTLRNRICHHEPIFKSDLNKIHKKMLFIIKYLDDSIFQLARKIDRISDLLVNKPV